MPRFEQPILVPANDRQFVLLEPYDYVYEESPSGMWYRIRVPDGYPTDIASVPRLAWSLTGLLPDGLHRGAAVTHDYLYQWRGRLPEGQLHESIGEGWQPSDREFNRAACDRIFLQAMQDAGVPAWKVKTMYWAVRLFGGRAWDAD